MTNLKKALALIAVLALPACKGKDLPGAPDPTVPDLPTSEELSIEVVPKLLVFTHVVGRSPCPQRITRVFIINNGQSPFTTDITPQAPSPLSFSVINTTVQPGGRVAVEVFFTCASQKDFEVTVDTLRTPAPVSQFVVRGMIVR
jgi:hypothetical protein